MARIHRCAWIRITLILLGTLVPTTGNAGPLGPGGFHPGINKCLLDRTRDLVGLIRQANDSRARIRYTDQGEWLGDRIDDEAGKRLQQGLEQFLAQYQECCHLDDINQVPGYRNFQKTLTGGRNPVQVLLTILSQKNFLAHDPQSSAEGKQHLLLLRPPAGSIEILNETTAMDRQVDMPATALPPDPPEIPSPAIDRPIITMPLPAADPPPMQRAKTAQPAVAPPKPTEHPAPSSGNGALDGEASPFFGLERNRAAIIGIVSTLVVVIIGVLATWSRSIRRRQRRQMSPPTDPILERLDGFEGQWRANSDLTDQNSMISIKINDQMKKLDQLQAVASAIMEHVNPMPIPPASSTQTPAGLLDDYNRCVREKKLTGFINRYHPMPLIMNHGPNGGASGTPFTLHQASNTDRHTLWRLTAGKDLWVLPGPELITNIGHLSVADARTGKALLRGIFDVKIGPRFELIEPAEVDPFNTILRAGLLQVTI